MKKNDISGLLLKGEYMNYSNRFLWLAALMLMIVCLQAEAQEMVRPVIRPFAANIIVPQRRVFVTRGTAQVQITKVTARVKILKQVATTTIFIDLRNPTRRRLQAEMLVPVPDGAVVKGFTFQGSGKEPSARLLPKDEARKTYDSIVSSLRDPALLEFVGYNVVRSSVFPIEANGTQKVRLTYEHILPADNDRIDYILPRSASVDYSIPWDVTVHITAKKAISTVYSPSHKVTVTREKGSKEKVTVKIAPDAVTEPGAFKLSYLIERNGVTASLFAYPDPKVGGGYFLLLAGLPAELPKQKKEAAIKREVTLVFDRSGSMNGEKIKQVREAAFQILSGLEKGEAFNIMVYNEAVDIFSKHPVIKSDETVKKARDYLESINARGGTNIHDALLEALRQKPVEGTLPIVLFLTDGLPTIGKTSEVDIRDLATKANPHSKRVFTFGVGVDVNTPLLDKIANVTRAVSTYVLPKEDVELKVANVFKRLSGPVLSSPLLDLVDEQGKSDPSRAKDMIPAKLPDLFEGDQLVLLGQYNGKEPLYFKLSGNYLGKARAFNFSFKLDSATTRNSFVPRLWASRKIAVLIDAIRELGADSPMATIRSVPPATDKRVKELVDEIIRLSVEFGILTEYTAFLAREGTDLARMDYNFATLEKNLKSRAMHTRSGVGSVNQSMNNDFQRAQVFANNMNRYFDQNMKQVSIRNVQQMNNRAYYKRGNRWIDSRLVQQGNLKPAEEVKIGSDRHRQIVKKLEKEGRQNEASLDGDTLIEVEKKAVLLKK
jgi:Ca-activated chloride channel family protein